MAENASENSCVVGLSTNDITPNVYEGGYKTWECSIDLANYVLAMLRAENYSLAGRHHFVEVEPDNRSCSTYKAKALLYRLAQERLFQH